MINTLYKISKVYQVRPYWAFLIVIVLTCILTLPIIITFALIAGVWIGILIGETSHSNTVGTIIAGASVYPAMFFAHKLVIKYIKPIR